ncbi:MAG: Uma2 family endonuclease [Chloroflexota bacterium]|nr:Uma2 family endonuclease [Chloroflexota bacterium]
MSALDTTIPAPTSIERRRMSYEEYKHWEHQGGLTEWVDGEVHIYMPPTILHQRMVAFLAFLLQGFVRLHRLGEVLSAPITMRAIEGANAREPDLFFLATEHLGYLTETELNGPADLAVEIISLDSVLRDRDDKFYEYQAGGIREYWIIDPRPKRKRADFFVLDQNGMYQPVPVADGIYRSAVLPNFWLKIDWLWAEDPNALAYLAEVVGVEQLLKAIQSDA